MAKPPNRSTARRPNTANTITAGVPVAPVPPFHSRRTLAEYVHDNMHFANRHALQHRVGVVAMNCPTKSRDEIKQFLEATINGINMRTKESEHISGFVVLYPTHTVMVLTGADRSFGQFKDNAGQMFVQSFVSGRILYFHGNVNQVYNLGVNIKCLFYETL